MSRRQPLTTCTAAPTPLRALLLHAWAFYRDNLADENVVLPVLLADLGLETGGIQKLVAEGMVLHAPYDPDQELLTLGTGERSQHRFLLDDVSEGAVGLSAETGSFIWESPTGCFPCGNLTTTLQPTF